MAGELRRAASNEELNKLHYDERYRVTDVDRLVSAVEQMPGWLDHQITTHNSWRSFYYGDLQTRLAGKRVLELGAGDGLNALVMAALGAHVVATDISEMTPKLVHAARERLDLAGSIEGFGGPIADWAEMVEPRSYDFVVGKAILHHLTHEEEREFLAFVAEAMRPGAEGRFSEPAVNSKVLDAIRWAVPVPGRPSALQRAKFAEYRATDPHPIRDNSSAHFMRSCREFFDDVECIPLGALERFNRLFPNAGFNNAFRRRAFWVEDRIPRRAQLPFARTQVILLAGPRHATD
ncbi:MAG: class I SAM-dependent methyltransferase [Actinomycetota bacterium]